MRQFWGALSAPFFLVHRRRSAFILRLLHDEDEWQHTDKDDHHETEGVVESQHIRLSIDHSDDGGVGLAAGGRGVGSGRYHASRHGLDRRLGRWVISSHMRAQIGDVYLLMSAQDRGHAGDPDARTDVAHEIEQAGSVADLFFGNGIIGDGSEWNEEQSHRGALDDQRNKEIPIACV